MEKTELRSTMIARRKNYYGKKDASDRITKHVIQRTEWKNAKRICIYQSLPTEVDTRMLIAIAKKQKKTICFPPTSDVDLFIVPGVAFDRKGNRLGRGSGYYDRLLTGIGVPKIGLAYSFQIVAEVPHSSYDVPMTMVITEEETLCR